MPVAVRAPRAAHNFARGRAQATRHAPPPWHPTPCALTSKVGALTLVFSSDAASHVQATYVVAMVAAALPVEDMVAGFVLNSCALSTATGPTVCLRGRRREREQRGVSEGGQRGRRAGAGRTTPLRICLRPAPAVATRRIVGTTHWPGSRSARGSARSCRCPRRTCQSATRRTPRSAGRRNLRGGGAAGVRGRAASRRAGLCDGRRCSNAGGWRTPSVCGRGKALADGAEGQRPARGRPPTRHVVAAFGLRRAVPERRRPVVRAVLVGAPGGAGAGPHDHAGAAVDRELAHGPVGVAEADQVVGQLLRGRGGVVGQWLRRPLA